jgi:hypothetical protein
MTLSLYSVYKAWRRDVEEERATVNERADENEEVPLGYC